MIKTANPAMRPFEEPQTWDQALGVSEARRGTMTIGGVAQATGVQLGFAVAGAALGWLAYERQWLPMGSSTVVFLGIFGVLFLGGLFMARRPERAKVLGPIFSALYGFVAGTLSYAVAFMLGGILSKNPELIGASEGLTRGDLVARGAGVIFQAVLLTFGVVAALVIAVGSGLLRVSGTLARVVVMMTGALMLTYVVSMVLNLFGLHIPYIHETGPLGIAFSGFAVVVASLNLAMQFTMVQDAVRAGAPRSMEWYAGYAIISTVIWLYIEILILLYKIYASSQRQ